MSTDAATNLPWGDRRQAGLRAIFIGDGATVDANGADAAIALLRVASEKAMSQFPALRGQFAGVGVYAASTVALPESLRRAAGAEGCQLHDLDVAETALVAQCDIALVASPRDLSRAGLLPALILRSDPDGGLAFDPGGADPLSGGERRAATTPTAPSDDGIAQAAMATPSGANQTRKLLEYLSENHQGRVGKHAYDLLLRMLGIRQKKWTGPASDPWTSALSLATQARTGALGAVTALRDAYERADALAVAYGERWRSILVARSFLLVAMNALSGLLGALFPTVTFATIPIQVGATALIFVDQRFASKGRWREKWLEYRLLAENLRVCRFTVLCGSGTPRAAELGWIDWLKRRIALPCDKLRDDEAKAVIEHLVHVEIAEQIDYHRGAVVRFRTLDHRLRRAATYAIIALMVVALGLAAIIVARHSSGGASQLAAIGLLLAAAPAIFAALNDARRDLDVIRQARRSARISVRLKRLARAISDAPVTADTARDASARAAEIMLDEVGSWRGILEVL